MLTLEMQKLIKQTNQAGDQTTCVTTKFFPRELRSVAELQGPSLTIVWSHIITSTQYGLIDHPLDCESLKQRLVLFLSMRISLNP